MSNPVSVRVLGKDAGHAISETLYGIFFEDINFSCDGGINANMVNNYSFDGLYFDNEKMTSVKDPLRFWQIEGGELVSGSCCALSENSLYGTVKVAGEATLSNLGYNGHKTYAEDCAMAIKTGHEYLFEAWVRGKFEGTVTVGVTKICGCPLTETAEIAVCGEWTKVSATLKGEADAYGKLVLTFKGEGCVDLDCVSLMDADFWGKGDPKWKHGRLRRDLIEALQGLKPTFMRFPGGCIVEGKIAENEYNWKNTVGELYDRKTEFNLWAEKLEDGSYNQSYQIGFYEYLCLCEDLGMKPLPTLSAGLNCQIRSMQRGETVCPNIPVDCPEFESYIIANYLDLIDFAKGEVGTSKWADLRAEMGHPAPFELDRIGIGNENYDKVYLERFELIRKAVIEKDPTITCIMCGGVHPYDMELMGAPGLSTYYKECAAKGYTHVLVDEHSYHTPDWFERMNTRFDNYDRNGAGVYFGEYAANGLLGLLEARMSGVEGAADALAMGGMRPMDQSNMLDTALGEAAFLCGIERNADIVRQASYAPLFNLVESDQWNHNLIDFNPKTVCLTTNYYVQQMFGTHIGSTYLPTEGELPEHVFVSATEKDGTVFVKVVNTRDGEYDLTLNMADAVACEEALILASANPMVRNALKFKGETEYGVQPENLDVCTEGNAVKMTVKPYSVAVVTLKV